MGMLLFLKKITPLSISDLCLANISITDELKYFLIPRIDQKEKKERKLLSPPPLPNSLPIISVSVNKSIK